MNATEKKAVHATRVDENSVTELPILHDIIAALNQCVYHGMAILELRSKRPQPQVPPLYHLPARSTVVSKLGFELPFVFL